ncbi:antibiotic biosynthesis monooxygenase [Altericista sp. CCNU0014]|uniref:antibiotic biosynthesis monooxygenase n=1 Tax=Altericista sp. CCNU0014 TaxID=3082949 RepID=UPI00384AF802
MTKQIEQLSNASIVIEYDEIASDKEAQFLQWQSEIQAGLNQFEGYLKTDVCRPIRGMQEKWYIVVHFDSPAHLGEWLDSDIRHHIIGKGKKKFGPYRYKIQAGFEGWFGQRNETNASVPAWKQNFAVLFGLYPTVMLETLLFSHLGIMESWPLAPKMFVNNLISCSLLTWIVMPLTTALLNFWLKPRQASGEDAERSRALVRTDIIGTLLVFVAYGFAIAIFQSLAQ